MFLLVGRSPTFAYYSAGRATPNYVPVYFLIHGLIIGHVTPRTYACMVKFPYSQNLYGTRADHVHTITYFGTGPPPLSFYYISDLANTPVWLPFYNEKKCKIGSNYRHYPSLSFKNEKYPATSALTHCTSSQALYLSFFYKVGLPSDSSQRPLSPSPLTLLEQLLIIKPLLISKSRSMWIVCLSVLDLFYH